VQRGDPDCTHHHHTTAREHSGTPNHLDGPGADHRTTTRYKAPTEQKQAYQEQQQAWIHARQIDAEHWAAQRHDELTG
jgi:hypothetical protein